MDLIRFLSLSTVLALLAFIVPAGATELYYTSIIGKWQVSGVEVIDNESGIQALTANDPQYMGAVVEFGRDKIIWLKGTKSRKIDPAIDNCNTAPKLTPADNNDADSGGPVKNGYNIICGNDGWGPGAIVIPISAKKIKIYWYDNGLLILSRQK